MVRTLAGAILRTLRSVKIWYQSQASSEASLEPDSYAQRRTPLHNACTADRYLEVLKKYLVRYDFGGPLGSATRKARTRAEGRDWPPSGETMIGLHRLDNLEMCIRSVLDDDVPGDLIECGVWRGGVTIFMRAVLDALGNEDKLVWVADSFEGLPRPDTKNYPADRADVSSWFKELVVPIDEVKANFARYGLLDDRVRFLEGWFKDTLPTAPIEQLSVLRLDGDLYESTMQSLQYLYPKLAPGGYVIIDDFGAVPACAQAVRDYRSRNTVGEEIQKIDWTGVYWRKEG